VVLGADGRDEVHEEGEDVEGEDEGDDPFEDGGGVEVLLLLGYAESWKGSVREIGTKLEGSVSPRETHQLQVRLRRR